MRKGRERLAIWALVVDGLCFLGEAEVGRQKSDCVVGGRLVRPFGLASIKK